MYSLFIEFLIPVLLILLSGLFAMGEVAILSARKNRLQELADQGNRSAETALRLESDQNHLLATVRLGITALTILNGVFCGSTLAPDLAVRFVKLPYLEYGAYEAAIAIVVAVITYCSLIAGEVVPKRIAIANSERIALVVARPLALLEWILRPFVKLLNFSSGLFVSLFNLPESQEPPITEEEITILLEEGTEAGVVELAEQSIVRRVLRLGDRPIDSLMTPRTDLVCIDASATAAELIDELTKSRHNYYPICCGSFDDIKGIIAMKDLWEPLVKNHNEDWQAYIKPAFFLPGSTDVLKLLEHFQEKNTHVAMIVDEYGGVDGMVTLDDIVESVLVAGAPDSLELERPIVERSDGTFLVDGTVTLDDFNDFFDYRFEEDANRGYHTIAGYVMDELGHVPKAADFFESRSVRFEVMDMDGNRVDKILVTRLNPEPPDDDESA